MDLFRKADGPFPAGDKRLEQSPALAQRQPAQAAAVEIKEIEGIEEDGAGFIRRWQGAERTLQHPEVRTAVVVEHNGFAIEDGCLHGEQPRVVSDRGKLSGPIVAAAREHPHPPGFDVDREPVSIPFHLVGPVWPLRRLADERRKAGIDACRHGIGGGDIARLL